MNKDQRQSLLASELRYRRLFETAQDGILILNFESGRITDANPFVINLLGFSHTEVLGKTVGELSPFKDIAANEVMLDQLQKHGFVRYDDLPLQSKDGRKHSVEFVSNVYQVGPEKVIQCNIRDITARKKTAERLLLLSTCISHLNDIVIVTEATPLDEPGPKIVFVNAALERICGYTAAESLGRSPRFLQGAKTDRKVLAEIREAMKKQVPIRRQLVNYHKNGSTYWLDIDIVPIFSANGQCTHFAAIERDITEAKTLERQFLRAQRMESIGTLAGGIAHDLNNILTPIMMSIEVLQATATDPEAIQILDVIRTSSKRGADIVRQVLTFARGMEGERIEIQPRHILNEIRTIIADTFPKSIRLEISSPAEPWLVLGDPTQLHQILLNLCVNARDAMAYGGKLTVTVENLVLDEQYAAMHLHATVGPHVIINVTDSGVGIAPAIIDKIFEPFFTTKKLGEGSGLGLSTVIAIVKSHGGFVNVYSELGKGSTFRIGLPAREVSSRTGAVIPTQANPPRGSGETILLIDDEPAILAVTSATLQAFGYQTLLARDGAEAVAIYAVHRHEISVVLTDIAMPIMDGYSTIRALLKIDPSVKAIAASGFNDGAGTAKMPVGAIRRFLGKPYTAATLLEAVHSVLTKSLADPVSNQD